MALQRIIYNTDEDTQLYRPVLSKISIPDWVSEYDLNKFLCIKSRTNSALSRSAAGNSADPFIVSAAARICSRYGAEFAPDAQRLISARSIQE
jgi:hypothetical protein